MKRTSTMMKSPSRVKSRTMVTRKNIIMVVMPL
jgi:hypothetical protein